MEREGTTVGKRRPSLAVAENALEHRDGVRLSLPEGSLVPAPLRASASPTARAQWALDIMERTKGGVDPAARADVRRRWARADSTGCGQESLVFDLRSRSARFQQP